MLQVISATTLASAVTISSLSMAWGSSSETG
jgi:hypothetical protein